MNKPDVMRFYFDLELNLFKLHEELLNKTYRHGSYVSFYIHDPKRRHINKAQVRDRILHHAIFSILNPIFEPTYIAESFSCRDNKGTHKGVRVLAAMLRRVSGNGINQCYGLKGDVKKFFDSVDHKILKEIISKKIKDTEVLRLVSIVIDSYKSKRSEVFAPKGIPIGNLTSQLFANLYLNELDQFVKHGLKIKNYARYTDDFVIVARDKEYLEAMKIAIDDFLKTKLKLELHPDKVIIRKFGQGLDFLGYVVKERCLLLRTKTKRRILKKMKSGSEKYQAGLLDKADLERSLQSYLGVLSHAKTRRLREKLINDFWFWTAK
jgi:retron-type reverse transcriptase